MEANFVLKAGDLSADFADGICKLFSPSAVLHITVQYNIESASSTTAAPVVRRGRKPKQQVAAAKKIDGRKTGGSKKLTAKGEVPKKRGRKPKNATA